MKKALLIFLSLILFVSICSCGSKQVSSVKLPDGVNQVKYKIAKEKTFNPYSGACDIYNATVDELKDLSLVSYDKTFGMVRNEQTAVDVATIVVREIYPESDCNKTETPFVVHYNECAKAWIVHGTLPKFKFGGVASIAIDKKTGKILMIIHTK